MMGGTLRNRERYALQGRVLRAPSNGRASNLSPIENKVAEKRWASRHVQPDASLSLGVD